MTGTYKHRYFGLKSLLKFKYVDGAYLMARILNYINIFHDLFLRLTDIPLLNKFSLYKSLATIRTYVVSNFG